MELQYMYKERLQSPHHDIHVLAFWYMFLLLFSIVDVLLSSWLIGLKYLVSSH